MRLTPAPGTRVAGARLPESTCRGRCSSGGLPLSSPAPSSSALPLWGPRPPPCSPDCGPKHPPPPAPAGEGSVWREPGGTGLLCFGLCKPVTSFSSTAPPLSQLMSPLGGDFPVCGNLSSFSAPSQGRRFCLDPFEPPPPSRACVCVCVCVRALSSCVGISCLFGSQRSSANIP